MRGVAPLSGLSWDGGNQSVSEPIKGEKVDSESPERAGRQGKGSKGERLLGGQAPTRPVPGCRAIKSFRKAGGITRSMKRRKR